MGRVRFSVYYETIKHACFFVSAFDQSFVSVCVQYAHGRNMKHEHPSFSLLCRWSIGVLCCHGDDI